MKNDVFKVEREVQKMSKSKYNVVNPDDICDSYGADNDLKLEVDESTKQEQHVMAANGEV